MVVGGKMRTEQVEPGLWCASWGNMTVYGVSEESALGGLKVMLKSRSVVPDG